MKDGNKTKQQLIRELIESRRRIVRQERSFNKQLQEIEKASKETDKKLKRINNQFTKSMDRVFEALEKISRGDPEVRIPEKSEIDIISNLNRMVNTTAKNIGEMVAASHEFAMSLAEHFDVLHRVSNNDFSARVSGKSKIELLESLKNVTNKMIKKIEMEINERKKAERNLISEKTFTDSLLKSMPGVFYLFNKKGHLIRWNENLEQVSGYSSEEIASMSPLEFFTGKNKQLVKKAIQEVFIKGYSTVEADLISKDGRSIPHLFTGLRLVLNKKSYLVGMGIDITERKQAETQLKVNERFLTNILESIQDGISVLDTELTVIHINPTMEKWYKGSMPIVGNKCYQVYHGLKSPCEICPSQRTIKTGNADYEVVLERDDKGDIIRYIGLYSFPLVDTDTGKTKGVIEYVRDITEQKNAEVFLKAKEKELQKRVKELEEFYDMAVGRELRVIELKKEIDRLSKELEKYNKQ